MKTTEITKRLLAADDNIAGVIIQQQGNTIYEQYFHGADASSNIHVFSITKSILSLLLGIAMSDQAEQYLNQDIRTFFPTYDQSGKNRITLWDVLTMKAPFKHHENPPYEALFTSSNYVAFTYQELDFNGTSDTFTYRPLLGPDVLTGVLSNLTKQSVVTYANEHLFEPCGIQAKTPLCFESAQAQFAFQATQVHEQGWWVCDQHGNQTAGWGLTLTTKELATIGQCLCQQGSWKQQQVIPTTWIKEATSKQAYCAAFDAYYGYLWWVLEDGFAAMGDGGNLLYVNPEKELVITITAFFKPDANDRLQLLYEQLLPLL